MRFLKRALVALALLLVIVVGAVYALAHRELSRTYTVARRAPPPATDSAAAARGEHLATAIGKCVGCHGDDLGGSVIFDDAVMGHVAAPNLTRGRGGVGADRTDADFATAIRHGVGQTGQPLLIMPSENYIHFSEADLSALIGYIRSRPSVDREVPARRFGPVGFALVASKKLPFSASLIDHEMVQPDSVAPGPTVEYGRYLAHVGGCTGCHNPSLSGGEIPGGPPGTPIAANLTPGGRPWTLELFRTTLRTGQRPGGGSELDSFMPIRYTKLMTDEEIEAVWRYVVSVPAKQLGER
jgi:mono/diheme cytochrome c family protein